MAKPIDSFRNRLEQALSYADMKPADLARKTGISEATISQYRSGYSKPKNDRLAIIAEALGVRPEWLIGFDVPMAEKETAQIPEGYYLDNDAKDMIEFLYQNPEYKVLFDATRKVKPEDINFVKEMIERMGRE